MNKPTLEMLTRLQQAGISLEDALVLRRAAMTLHRWHELECGDGDAWKSWCITRGRKENGEFIHDDDGKPFMEVHPHYDGGKTRYEPLPDREKGARKRIRKVLERYKGFQAYIQGDPRGAALYVLPPGTVRDGEDVSSVYSRGIAVYR